MFRIHIPSRYITNHPLEPNAIILAVTRCHCTSAFGYTYAYAYVE